MCVVNRCRQPVPTRRFAPFSLSVVSPAPLNDPAPKVACMDFAHLKGDFNGTMGTISTKSANNNVVHLATCIVAKETGDAYRYMINNAKKNPAVAAFLDKPSTTVITDKHKGSDSAIPDTLPQTEHLSCVEHLLKSHGTVGPVRWDDPVCVHFLLRPYRKRGATKSREACT